MAFGDRTYPRSYGATGAGLEANTEIQSNLISQANTEQNSRQFESALESKDLEIKS